jgi:hypothetical protein
MKIYWDENGQTACERHMPYAGSDTFVSGRWHAMTLNERVSFAAELGHAPTCETCDAVARRHAEGAHAERKNDECALCAGGAA